MNSAAITRLSHDDTGAVAVTYALSLTALIVIAGVGFDYGRLAAMDSELQNGADQAALAGATQLNGASGACLRASVAAVSLVTNITVVANSANTVTIASEPGCDATGKVKFYQDKARATAATTDANARFIEVTVDNRTVDYAFTPIAGLITGSGTATALAGLGSSVCKVPPVFMCNPDQNGDAEFTIANYIGKGIRLVANDGGGNYGGGNFGYLQSTAANGAAGIADVLGKTDIPGDCVSAESVTTKPGATVSVLDALNTRFDIYTGNTTNPCGNNGAGCQPSANTRKDLIYPSNGNGNGNGNGNTCSNPAAWAVPTNGYAPTTTTPLNTTQIAATAPMGYPRDICHAIGASGNCARGIIGDGVWDRNAYFKTNSASTGASNYTPTFDWSAVPAAVSGSPTRYEVYKFEAANFATRLQPQTTTGGSSQPQPFCVSPGVPVGGAAPDRRVLSMAVINCGAGLNGTSGPLAPKKWVDVFLTEPSIRRTINGTQYTENSDVYIEVIGRTTLGGGSVSAQQIRRDVPYLVE